MRILKYIFTTEQIQDKLFWLRLVLGLGVMLLLVAQLFSYERFYEALIAGQPTLGPIGAIIIIVLLPVCELFALPALLSMNLSPVYIRISASIAKLLSLSFIALILNTCVGAPGDSTGLLGATLPLPASFPIIVLAILFAIAAWYSTARQVERPTNK